VTNRVVARSASDKTDDWPYWMVWDGTTNVTAETIDALGLPRSPGAVLTTREMAQNVAEMYNSKVLGIHK
jgi:hypothetical protein